MSELNFARGVTAMKGEAAYRVMAQAAALEAQGKSVIHLEIGQPDFPTPPRALEAGMKALHEGKTRYVAPLGIPEFRNALAAYVARTRGIHMSTSSIAVTPSGKTAILLAMAAVLEKGDEVIFPDPGFPTYADLVAFFGAVARPVPLREASGFSFDREALRAAFSPKTKLVIINSPSNPTGGVHNISELEYLAGLVRASNAWVLSDEIYSRIVYDGMQCAPSIVSLPDMQARTFLLDGFSKTYAMTGWRLGFLAFPSRFENAMDMLLMNTVGCTAPFVQYAGLAALDEDESVRHMVSEFETRRNYLVSALNKISGVRCAMPRGAFYAFPNVNLVTQSAQQLADFLLREAGVALLSGSAFGKEGETYLRISYAASLETLKEGVSRIAYGVQLFGEKIDRERKIR